ncbi:MAG TPA: NAD(P)/FAD-dependent oxidoreductase [Nitriliruptorales bacterium]|nr:NAD(P)/FAD-dependent oxidoreductase [Nitriliruptorales bacterium]
MTQEYDVVVLGGGTAGENAAWYAIDNGMTAVVVEQELVGGECTFWACMPSKALLRPGEVLAAVRRVPGAEPAVTGSVDVGRTLRSRDSFAEEWDDKHQVEWLEDVGGELVRGRGRLAGERTVEVTQEDGTSVTLRARKAVIVATGSSPLLPPIDGLRETRVWGNRAVTSLKEVPRSLLVLGGGAVGVEIAQAWRWLGVEQVTIVELFDRLLAREEPFAGRQLRQRFEAIGIAVLTGARVIKVHRDRDDTPVVATLEDGRQLSADEILVAVGRDPNTRDIGLETVGLQGGGPLETDDQLHAKGVTGGWLYAVGDVNGKALFTHQGKYQARLVGDIIAGQQREDWADVHAVPRVVFTDPQVAAVGLTEQQAREEGLEPRILQVDLTSAAGGKLLGKDVTGTAQLVVDPARRVVVGATFTGPGVGELLHAATIAIVSEVSLDRLWHAVPAFPTVSEVWLRLLEADRSAVSPS